MKTLRLARLLVSLAFFNLTATGWAQGTAYTYHGRLVDHGSPANGTFDLTFSLFDGEASSSQVGQTITNTALDVADGLFTATLDFGPGIFTGPERWLQIGVRTNGTSDFTLLNPRLLLTPTPYAIMANSASNLLGTLPTDQLSGTLSDGQLPSNLARLDGNGTFSGAFIFNNSANVFSGNGRGLTGLNPANLLSGTAAIDISGHAATATNADTANNFSGTLAGDVSGPQKATVIANVGGQSAASIASGSSAANAATPANTPDTIVRRDGAGDFSAGAITAASVSGDGSGLNALNASQLASGTLTDERLSPNVALLNAHQTFSGSNRFSGVVQLTNADNTFSGNFTGNGNNLTALNPAKLSAGTAAIDISGHAATATAAITADSAATAASAGSAAIFTDPLAGDVTGSQGATVVATVGGQSAFSIANGSSAANAATPANTPDTIVRRDGAGNFTAGAITASSLSGDGSGLTKLNASELVSGTLGDERLSSNVALLNAHQTFTGSNTFNGVLNVTNTDNRFVGTFSGDGAALSNLFVHAANVLGTLSATQLIGPLPADLLVGPYTNALTLNNPANSYTGNGAGLTGVNADSLAGLGAASFWQLGGNAGTTAGINFLGTTDDQPLELKVNGQRAYRLEPTAGAPNVIGGSSENQVVPGSIGTTISGGYSNLAGTELTVNYVTLAGGAGNSISDANDFSTISGGYQNQVLKGGDVFYGATNSTIGGGYSNTVWVASSVISGGTQNTIGQENSGYGESGHTIGGGTRNIIGYEIIHSTISGGASNFLDSSYSTIAGGGGNIIGWAGFALVGNSIGGGVGNYVTGGWNAIGGGRSNQLIGTYSVIPGGFSNIVSASYSFAAGRRASATNQGTFVWADSNDFDFPSLNADEFAARCVGGARFVSGIDADGVPISGVELIPGEGSWSSLSDRNAKENFAAVNTRAVLDRVAQMPITTWNYKSQDTAVRHIGPMAQDFAAAFKVGASDRRITTVDADGVALAAIQGLNQVVQEQQAELKQKTAEIQSLQQRLEVLEWAVLGFQTAQNQGKP